MKIMFSCFNSRQFIFLNLLSNQWVLRVIIKFFTSDDHVRIKRVLYIIFSLFLIEPWLAGNCFAQEVLYTISNPTYSLSDNAGDVDNDGSQDFIAFGSEKNGLLFVDILSGRDGKTTLYSFKKDNEFGRLIAGLGDLNNDVFADFAIGTRNPTSAFVNYINIYSGKDGSILKVFSFPLSGKELQLTIAIKGIQDLNVDDYDDFIIIEKILSKDSVVVKVRIISGKDFSQIHEFIEPPDTYFPRIGVVGDINGDLYGDISISYSRFLSDDDVKILSGKSGVVIHKIHMDHQFLETSNLFGYSVTGIGDINKDGWGDFAVGAPQYDINPRAGEHLGETITNKKGFVNIYSGLNATLLKHIEGEAINDKFGSYVAGGSDYNSDGISDFIVEARGAAGDLHGHGESKLYVFSGKDFRIIAKIPFEVCKPNAIRCDMISTYPLGDINNDGTQEIAIHRWFNYIKVYSIKNLGVQFLNGVDFSKGGEISSIPDELALGGSAVDGVVTDGVTRMLIRINVDKPSSFILTLNGTNNSHEDGILRSIDGFQEGNTIAVRTVMTKEGEKAFAIYQAPDNFVRNSYKDLDQKSAERILSIVIKNSISDPIKKEIKLVRPPVVLVHGLWSSPDMWNDFGSSLAKNFPGISIFFVDYHETNAKHFKVNRDVLRKSIYSAKKNLLVSDKIAAVQVDVMGHSMGGILSRIYIGGETWPGGIKYKRKDNFYMGDINKLITLDSVHFGSFLADFGINFSNGLPLPKRLFLLKALQIIKMPLDEGAVEDLQTLSPQTVYLNSVPTDAQSHAIVGDFVVNVDLADAPGQLGDFFKILKHFGANTKPDIIPGESDLVVSVKSQAGGLLAPTSSIFNHYHTGATTVDVLEKTVELLNESSDDTFFNKGFPINLYP